MSFCFSRVHRHKKGRGMGRQSQTVGGWRCTAVSRESLGLLATEDAKLNATFEVSSTRP